LLENKLLRQLETEIFPRVAKPGRYTGNETNIIRKNHVEVAVSVALAFPDLYDVGMSYYGFQILYHLLNREKDIVAERVFAPWDDMEAELRRHAIPLYSLESKTALKDFDLLGFTLQYELCYSNVLNMLDLAGIPLRSRERGAGDPFIVAGGGCAYNPEPLADFVDFFFIGDAEESIVPVVRELARLRRDGLPREQILRKLATGFSGIYAPSLYHVETGPDGQFDGLRPDYDDIPPRIKANRVAELAADNYPEKPIMPLVEIAQDRLVAEIMRGCTQGCRFCQAGMLYRPIREREPDELTEQILKSLQATGYDDLSLLSLSTSDYTGLQRVVEDTTEFREQRRISISLPSLRLDSFSEGVAQAASQTRKSGLTFAPEAGSERLRRVINKRISEDELLQSVEIALRHGWRSLKLYFMLGLPTETDDDLQAIVDLTARVLAVGKSKLTLNVTLSPFIPKAFTPFQWEAQDSPEENQRKLDFLKPRLRELKFIKVMGRDPQVSRLEGIMARGDRRLSDVIYRAWEKGARFDSWTEFFAPQLWSEAFAESGVNPDDYIKKIATDAVLPWEIIDPLISRAFLLGEREKALRAESTTDCRSGCLSCGVCVPGALDMRIAGESASVPAGVVQETAEPLPTRYRLKFKKGPEIRFTSQLDLMRIFQRALRQSGLDLRYTGGFNQRPRISMGLALPFGYTSEAEYLEIVLNQPSPAVREKINAAFPIGLEILEVTELPLRDPAVSSLIYAARYAAAFEESLPVDINGTIDDFLSREEVIVHRIRSGRKKPFNVRAFVESIERDKNGGLLIGTSIKDGHTVKVDEILNVLGLSDRSYQVHRAALLVHEP